MAKKSASRSPRGRPPGNRAEHRRVSEQLRAGMQRGDWPGLAVLPSIRQLAKDLNSSVSAVRLALEHLARERLIALNPRRRWVVQRVARWSASSLGLVALVLSDPVEETSQGSYWMELHRGVLSGLARLQAPLLMLHDHALQTTQPEAWLDLPLRGVLLAGRFTAQNLRAYERLPLPVSYIDTPTDGVKLHSASADNTALARDAVQRMIALGHRRIALVRFVLYTLQSVDPDSQERQAGFATAMREAGLDPSGVYNHLPGRDTQHSLLALLRKRPRYTAVLCVGPASAQALLPLVQAEGLEIPRDLSLCCVQGMGERVPYSGPVLDFHELAKRATLLLQRTKLPPIRERIPATWRDRGSVVAVRGGQS